MIAWTLLVVSTVGLLYVFAHRLFSTKRDIAFQEGLKKEEAEAGEMESEEVVEEPSDAQKISPSAVKKMFSKGEVSMGRKHYDDARECFLAVIDSDENHLDAHLQLGLICMKQEDFPNAELYFSKLVNLKKDPVFFSNLGAALYRQARLIEAAEAYENAIAMDDKRANRLQSLAQVYHELGNYEKALKYFELASQRKPKDADLKMILAEYYVRLERLEEAVAVYEKLLESDPYNEDLKGLLAEIKDRL